MVFHIAYIDNVSNYKRQLAKTNGKKSKLYQRIRGTPIQIIDERLDLFIDLKTPPTLSPSNTIKHRTRLCSTEMISK